MNSATNGEQMLPGLGRSPDISVRQSARGAGRDTFGQTTPNRPRVPNRRVDLLTTKIQAMAAYVAEQAEGVE